MAISPRRSRIPVPKPVAGLALRRPGEDSLGAVAMPKAVRRKIVRQSALRTQPLERLAKIIFGPNPPPWRLKNVRLPRSSQLGPSPQFGPAVRVEADNSRLGLFLGVRCLVACDQDDLPLEIDLGPEQIAGFLGSDAGRIDEPNDAPQGFGRHRPNLVGFLIGRVPALGALLLKLPRLLVRARLQDPFRFGPMEARERRRDVVEPRIGSLPLRIFSHPFGEIELNQLANGPLPNDLDEADVPPAGASAQRAAVIPVMLVRDFPGLHPVREIVEVAADNCAAGESGRTGGCRGRRCGGNVVVVVTGENAKGNCHDRRASPITTKCMEARRPDPRAYAGWPLEATFHAAARQWGVARK